MGTRRFRRGTRTWWLPVAAGATAVAMIAIGVTASALRDAPRHSSAAPAALGPPRFVEEAIASGLEHRYDGDFNYFVGGGVAVFDCNSDGRPDLYLAGGSEPAALFLNESIVAGELRFSRRAGSATDLVAVTGSYPLDVDADGHVDLAVLRVGENVLLRGTGDCAFERANETWSFDGGSAWTTAFSAKWEDGASWPVLAFGHYLDASSQDNSRLCHDNELVQPVGSAGGFQASVPLSPGWCSLSMLFSDWDRSGRRDLRVTNDRHYYSDYSNGQDQLWRAGRTEAARLYSHGDGWQPLRIWGMGIASHDLTGDGYPEYFLTSQGDNKLQTLADGPRQPTYRDIALVSGATAHRPFAGGDTLPSTAWHAEFDDINNDALMDLFVAKGNVDAQPGYAQKDPSNLLLGQPDGTFVEAADDAGIVDFARGRGAALVDLNLDGMLDLIEVKQRENVRVWRNAGSGSAAGPRPMGNWLAVQPAQPGANRDAIGAWLEVSAGERTILREITIGGGHAGGQLAPIHFGLGSAEAAQLRVTWPDGQMSAWLPVPVNRQVLVERDATEVTVVR
jgi:hypothetical protein